MTLRIGILGAGFIAESHARGFASLPAERARLRAVASRTLSRAADLAGRYSAQAVPDLEALLPLVDAVCICTPTPSHGAYAMAALQAGKHVLCEKPMARTLAEAEQMLAAARQSGRKLMLGHTCRYEPEHRKAREVLARGDIGALRMAYHSATGPLPTWASDDWFADVAQSGGPILDLALHSFDYLLWLFAAPARRVYAAGDGQYALVSLRFEDGGIGQVEASWAHPRSAPFMVRCELTGTAGVVSWDYEQVAAARYFREGAGPGYHLMPGEDSFALQCDDFVRCVEADSPPPISGEDGLAALRVALAALESCVTGRAVAL
jgi:predicted dehydrogenase